MNKKLTIVIIGKNEGRSLQKTFSSVIKASKVFEDEFNSKPGVIYIDSNSTDNSVDIARRNNIKYKIITGRTTPAKGRIVGVESTESEYIFFLDGDTVVDKNWLCEGVEFLEKHKYIAGVGGLLIFNVFNTKGNLIWQDSNHWNNKKSVENIYDGVGGTFLYRRKYYLKSGGFSAKYNNTEEFDLMLRIIAKGYKIKRINIPMATHNDFKIKSVGFIKKNLFTKDIFISGHVCRNAPKTRGTLKVIVYRFWLYFLHLPMILTFLSFLIFSNWIFSIIISILLVLFHLIYKGCNVKRTIISIISMCFYSFGFYVGLIKG